MVGVVFKIKKAFYAKHKHRVAIKFGAVPISATAVAAVARHYLAWRQVLDAKKLDSSTALLKAAAGLFNRE